MYTAEQVEELSLQIETLLREIAESSGLIEQSFAQVEKDKTLEELKQFFDTRLALLNETLTRVNQLLTIEKQLLASHAILENNSQHNTLFPLIEKIRVAKEDPIFQITSLSSVKQLKRYITYPEGINLQENENKWIHLFKNFVLVCANQWQQEIDQEYTQAINYFSGSAAFNEVVKKLEEKSVDAWHNQDRKLLALLATKTFVFLQQEENYENIIQFFYEYIEIKKSVDRLYPNAGEEFYQALAQHVFAVLPKKYNQAFILGYVDFKIDPAHDPQKMVLLTALENITFEESSEQEFMHYQSLIAKSKVMKQTGDINDYIHLAQAVKKINNETEDEELAARFITILQRVNSLNDKITYANMCGYFEFCHAIENTKNLFYVGAGAEWAQLMRATIQKLPLNELQKKQLDYANAWVRLKEKPDKDATTEALCSALMLLDVAQMNKEFIELLTLVVQQTLDLEINRTVITLEEVKTYQSFGEQMVKFNLNLAVLMQAFIAPLEKTALVRKGKQNTVHQKYSSRNAQNFTHFNATVAQIIKKKSDLDNKVSPADLLNNLGLLKLNKNNEIQEFLDYLEIDPDSDTKPWVQNRGTSDTYVDNTYFPADGIYQELEANEYNSHYVCGLAHGINHYLNNPEQIGFASEFTRIFHSQSNCLMVVERKICYSLIKENYKKRKIDYEVVHLYKNYQEFPEYVGMFAPIKHHQDVALFIKDLIQYKDGGQSPHFEDTLMLSSSPTLTQGTLTITSTSPSLGNNRISSGSTSPSFSAVRLSGSQIKGAKNRTQLRAEYRSALEELKKNPELANLATAFDSVSIAQLTVSNLELLIRVMSVSLVHKSVAEKNAITPELIGEIEKTGLFPKIAIALKEIAPNIAQEYTLQELCDAYKAAHDQREKYPVLNPLLYAIVEFNRESVLLEKNIKLMTKLLNQSRLLLMTAPDKVTKPQVDYYVKLIMETQRAFKNSTLVKALYGIFIFVTFSSFILALIVASIAPPVTAAVGASVVASYFFEGGVITGIGTLAIRSYKNRWLPMFDALNTIKEQAETSALKNTSTSSLEAKL